MTEAREPQAGTSTGPGPEGWWSTFFVEDHARFQMALSEETHDSEAEADLLITLAGISQDSRVLDAPCGQGRHAIRLAQAGAVVTGVDSSPAMLERAELDAQNRGVNVRWIHADMRTVSWVSQFDCAICLGGSFGYFGRCGDGAFLAALRHAVRLGGSLVLDAPSLEFIRAHHRPVHESVVGGRPVILYRHLDPASGAARIRVVIDTEQGPVSRMYHQQLYTADELRTMIAAAGFAVYDVLDASDVSGFDSNRGHLLVLAH